MATLDHYAFNIARQVLIHAEAKRSLLSKELSAMPEPGPSEDTKEVIARLDRESAALRRALSILSGEEVSDD